MSTSRTWPTPPAAPPRALAEAVLLGRDERTTPHAVDVLVHDGGHIARRDCTTQEMGNMRLRKWPRPPGYTNGIVIMATMARRASMVSNHHEGEHRAQGTGPGSRGQRSDTLHGADVGVGARDELTRLHPVVEREREPVMVLVDDGAQSRIRSRRDPVQEVAGHEGRRLPGSGPDHQGIRRRGSRGLSGDQGRSMPP